MISKSSSLALTRRVPGLRRGVSKIRSKIKFNNFSGRNLLNRNVTLVHSLRNQNYFSYAKERYSQKSGALGKSAAIEINNSCNINCVMCDTKSSTRPKRLMDLSLFNDTVVQLKQAGIETVTLHTIGDPLANARLPQILSILRKNRLPIGVISTNGLLIHKHLESLIEYNDIVSNVRFSIDGATKDTYEKIRFGGNWEDLIDNLNLAQKALIPKGFEFYFDFVITRENFSEMGEFFSMFRKYTFSPYNINFHFMNSLAPSNSYFLLNNVLPEHTHPNYYCNFVAAMNPYILVDGQISVCCRDYDGSLVIGSINSNQGIEKANNSLRMGELRSATTQSSINKDNFPLCNTCFVVDSRVSEIWSNAIHYIKIRKPTEGGRYYQSAFEALFECIKNDKLEGYEEFIESL